MTAITSLTNVSFTRRRSFAINNLDLEIPEGKITTIIGPNGSGKSTILRLIMRLLAPNDGKIMLHGTDIHTISAKKLAREMTMLSQSPDGLIDVVVRDLVSYGRMPYKSWLGTMEKEDEEAVDWAMEVCNLEALAYRPLHTLSGGEKQRAWLAMALAQKTPILLLDEPTTYLDISHQLELLDLLRKLNRDFNMSIILVLHDLNQAAGYSDHVVVCEDGTIQKVGTPEEVFTHTLLRDIFKIEAEIHQTQNGLRVLPIASTKFHTQS
ncbi:ABC transporter ATP-binding protein [Listeria booriae]|uniref:ABC transporter ATP-binding protein n=1 Tax=Listeria booriae TaxID=1552123 RepID=A0A7X0XTB7_9LIST|nr:ABC transporter ATP-binding protein [Listeria booriae]MBC1227253.1 ABC transporter ATP-binding protein [Listeria booriae]MBC1235386.1 ABC transporter ATP-binding protein [Listeria booriae]MBC1247266.1 ABC transporter ATP-binding protein [Listeria booriae]MBC1285956.1 ABC transporter ATP-binding protein [Listeria booriae]MBC1309230.1 ABC transporter ATP-binding protein [Listeria booriae]